MTASEAGWEALAAWDSGLVDRWFKLDVYTKAYVVAVWETRRMLEAMEAADLAEKQDQLAAAAKAKASVPRAGVGGRRWRRSR
jgi:hypothetical protein